MRKAGRQRTKEGFKPCRDLAIVPANPELAAS
jgi:hypothetical protein